MSSTVTVLCSNVCNGPVATVRASTVTDIVTATSERLANVLPPIVKVGVNTAPFIVCAIGTPKVIVVSCAPPVLTYKVKVSMLPGAVWW